MSNLWWKALAGSSSVLSFLVLSNVAQGQELSVDELSQPVSSRSLDQVTSVSQLSDVQPTDWAFQALQSLVERYGCIAGYPDGTFRGNNFMTRFEFAAGLNACLDQIVAIIGGGEGVDPSDLATIRRLQEEFAAELATLRGRVDGLEARTAELEANQFSTTTKLNGEAIFALSDTFGAAVGDSSGDPTQTQFGYRVRLNFDASFSGRDRLRVRLQDRNLVNFGTGNTGTNMTRLGFAGTTNGVELARLEYRFPITDNIRGYLSGAGMSAENISNALSPQVSGGFGAISRFGRYNPVFRLSGGAGVGLNARFGDFGLDLGYLAGNANDPTAGNGLFNGEQGAFANLTFSPSNDFSLGVFYDRHHFPGGQVNLSGSTGSRQATNPFGSDVAVGSDTLGSQFRLGLGAIDLSGWIGFTWANAQNNGNGFRSGDRAEVINYALSLTAPDLGGPGNLAGLIVGVPPQATRVQRSDPALLGREDTDTSLHIEAFYRYRLNDNIAITPGFFVITNPEHNSNNDAQWVGTIRTTFSF
ncbi:iron uptake porin [Phormidium yuhuli AB48]|uniref:Iron uptake porin n=1 Tax=Phormidium yuhuli AB48 TaxID=2940671 RepID=A0ABY5AUD3_9CYAN|nr:iron uptake porin [Phormidium yuhuli]USR92839.1 iron uptake porin [Phormidium yuhuli AB48]